MSGLKGNPSTLKNLNKAIRGLPTVLAQRVARRSAGALSYFARTSYGSGETAYGDARPLGSKGNALTLVKSGKTLGALYFVAVGTIVRARLSTKYAKYLIGKYRILPIGGGALPVTWSEALKRNVASEAKAYLAEQGGGG